MRLRIWGQTHAENSSAAQSSGLTLFGENLNHLWISFGRGFPVPRVSLRACTETGRGPVFVETAWGHGARREQTRGGL